MDNSIKESFIEKLKNAHKANPNWLKVISISETEELYIIGYGGMGTLITLKANDNYIKIINNLIKNKKLKKDKKKDYLYELNTMVYWYKYND